MGPKSYLTYEEEELVTFLTNYSKMGYGKTRQDVMKIVEEYITSKSRNLHKRLSNCWWVCFIQQWSNLSLRKGDPFAVIRDQASKQSIFKSYFDLLGDVMTTHGLPNQIYNCDESGMPLQHKKSKSCVSQGNKKSPSSTYALVIKHR